MKKKEFESLVCPACSAKLDEKELAKKLICKKCGKKLKKKKYLAFLEFLMEQGIVTNIDFFDKKLYGDEIKKSTEGDELKDETDPDEYEDKKQKFEQYEDDMEVNEEEDEDETHQNWDPVEQDWQAFNKRQQELDAKKNEE